MSKIKKNFILEKLEFTDTSTEGKGIARHEGMVVFADGAVPGDVADIFIQRKKNSFAEGKLHTLLKPSPQRVEPACAHFGVCGGCKWQNLNYSSQLEFKTKYVKDAFDRIGKLEYPFVLPIKGNASPYFYRNKLEFSFSNKRWLTNDEMRSEEQLQKNGVGFHVPGLFDKVIDIGKCHLQNDLSNEIRNEIRDYALKNKLSFFDIREKKGMLRTLMIRTTSTGECMLVLAVCDYEEGELFALLDHLKDKFSGITSLMYTHNSKGNDSFDGLEMKLHSGRDHITEEMEGLRFRISPRSFYQTNSLQAYELYRITREFAQLSGKETVYDLYTGTGTIANFVAKQAGKVVGVEYIKDAIADAELNSRENGIHNTVFYAGDMKDVLNEEFIAANGDPDVIITDPPRAGMSEEVVNVLLKADPARIVYVSCNPSTQARDLAMMTGQYRIIKVQPVDMFPQTAHVENVVLLERR